MVVFGIFIVALALAGCGEKETEVTESSAASAAAARRYLWIDFDEVTGVSQYAEFKYYFGAVCERSLGRIGFDEAAFGNDFNQAAAWMEGVGSKQEFDGTVAQIRAKLDEYVVLIAKGRKNAFGRENRRTMTKDEQVQYTSLLAVHGELMRQQVYFLLLRLGKGSSDEEGRKFVMGLARKVIDAKMDIKRAVTLDNYKRVCESRRKDWGWCIENTYKVRLLDLLIRLQETPTPWGTEIDKFYNLDALFITDLITRRNMSEEAWEQFKICLDILVDKFEKLTAENLHTDSENLAKFKTALGKLEKLRKPIH